MRILRLVTIGVLTWVFSFLIADKAIAQNKSVKNFTTQDGLPSIEVFHILQDHAGFLWFSTSNGIASFDGYKMKAYSVDDGVPDPLVLETREDKSGRIWMRSFSGRIAYCIDDEIHPYAYNDALSKFCAEGFLEAFAQDSTGQWTFFEKNDSHATIDSTGFLKASPRLPRQRVSIKAYGDQLIIQNSIFEIDEHGMVMIDGKEFPIEIPYQHSKYTHHHYSVLRWRNNIYFNVKNHLFKYDGQTIEHVLAAGAPIINLSIDQSDRLYIGHLNRGVVQFTDESLQQGDTLSFTRNYSVTDVLEDQEGGLWVSTLEAGVFYMPATGITHHYLPGDHRIRTTLLHQDKIFIGTYDGLLVSLDEKTKIPVDEHKFDRTVLALHAHNDTLFVSTSTNLFVLKKISDKPVHQYSGSVQGMLAQKDHLIALTGRLSIYYDYDGKKRSAMRINQWIRNLYAEDSVFYAITHLGLEITDKKFNTLSRPPELQKLKISQLHFVNDTTLLVGTIGSGLMETDKAFNRISYFDGLPRDIYSIVKLGDYYYFASEQGIFRISTSDIAKRSPRAVLLNFRNGLLNRSISHLNVTSDGKLIVFYDRSFSIVDPEAMNNLNQTPRFYTARILVNNGKVQKREHYRLPYDSNTIKLEFGFVSFNNQDIDIRYRLQPGEQWVYPTHTNTIDLYSLSPGLYRPEIEYSADRYTWQSAGTFPTFHITYPWWQNPYLQLLAFIVICIIAIVIVANRLEIQRERNERLKLLTVQQQQLIDTEKVTTDRERNRIAKDLHDSVGSSLLATKLSVGRILKRYNHQEADEIEQQLANTLNEIKNIIYDLSPTELERDGFAASIKNYIDKLSGVTDIQLNVVFYGQDVNDARIITPVFRVLQELLSNSIKYSTGNSISLHINSFSRLLNIVYEDNGLGFSPAVAKGIGRGLMNIEARINSLDGQLKIDSGDYGTCFIMDIPTLTSSVE